MASGIKMYVSSKVFREAFLKMLAYVCLLTCCIVTYNYVEMADAVHEKKLWHIFACSHGNTQAVSSCRLSVQDLIKKLPRCYASPIRAACATIAPDKDLSTIMTFPLLAGLSQARIFCIEVNDAKYVLRVLDKKASPCGRCLEVQAHTIGAQLDIAPKLIYVDTAQLVVLMEYINGRMFTHSDLDDPMIINKVMMALKKLHQSSISNTFPRKTRVEFITDLYTRYKKKGIVYPSCFETLYRSLLNQAEGLRGQHVPSHGDLSPGNIMIGDDGNIYMIDWADVRIDSCFLDIGWLACLSMASDEHIRNMLRAYLERDPSREEMREALFQRNVTIFFIVTVWMSLQEERDISKLDAYLTRPLKHGSAYMKDGHAFYEVATKKGTELTEYTLGYLQEYIEKQALWDNK